MSSHETETLMTWTETIERYLSEGRTVSGGKHDQEKQMAQQRQTEQDAQTQKAFSAQMDTLNTLKTSLSKYLTGNEGFDPSLTAALKSKFLGSNAQDYAGARSSVMSALARRGSGGGQGPVGGDFAKGLSSLAGQEASTLGAGMQNIDIQNLQQAVNNKFNAASVLSGNAATLNSPINTFTGSADNALNQRIKIGMTPGFGTNFLNSLGSSLGAGLGAGATGGIGTLASHAGSGNYGW